MSIYRLKLRPGSSWATPWQADTVVGMLLSICARTKGADVLNTKFIEPMLAGAPPFVISDGLANNLLPAPLWLRLADWGENIDRKAIKKMSWLDIDSFNIARKGELPEFANIKNDNQVFINSAQHHNTLSRETDTTSDSDSGLAPFSQMITALLPDADNEYCLTIYLRFFDESIIDLVIDLFNELSVTGFGADISTGKGQFEFIDNFEPAKELNDINIENANGVISLSTFQPSANDSTQGLWQSFAKMGKLGPDVGLEDVRKNTLIMFRPGACFAGASDTKFIGRAVPMPELLPSESAQELKQRNINIIHPAFGLTVPIKFQ